MSDSQHPINRAGTVYLLLPNGTMAPLAADASGNLLVNVAAGGGISSGISTAITDGVAAITTTAAALPTVAGTEVIVQADSANTTNILVGSAASQHIALVPGASLSIPISNLNILYAKMASGTGNLNYWVRN